MSEKDNIIKEYNVTREELEEYIEMTGFGRKLYHFIRRIFKGEGVSWTEAKVAATIHTMFMEHEPEMKK